jgi:ATP-dependent protease Clp ATPase subunit
LENGRTLAICNECVDLCVEIIAEKSQAPEAYNDLLKRAASILKGTSKKALFFEEA